MASSLSNQKLTFLTQRLEQIWRQTDELPKTLGNLWQQADKFSGQTQELLLKNLQELSIDLSQLQEISEELRQQNEALAENYLELESELHQYVELFEFAPDGYIVTDKHAKILKANRAAAQMLNISREHLVKKLLVTFVAPQEHQNFYTKLNHLQQGKSLKHWQVQMQPLHGYALPMLFTVAPIQNPQGQVEGFRWRLMDGAETPSDTELRSNIVVEIDTETRGRGDAEKLNVLHMNATAYEQPSSGSSQPVLETAATTLSLVQEDSRLKTQSIYTFANETRNPLNAILVCAQLIESQAKSSTDNNQSHLLGLIQENAKRINHLLNDMLLIEKLKAGQVPLNPILLDLTRFCGQLIAELQQSVSKDHKIIFLHPEQSYPARLDEQVLQYILSHLLLTLIKYSPKPSEIQLKIAPSPQKIMFVIQILGRGIAKKDQQLLFNWLERGSDIDSIQRSDLSLAIVHHCVALYKGKISIDSKVESRTTISVTLPLLSEVKRKRVKISY